MAKYLLGIEWQQTVCILYWCIVHNKSYPRFWGIKGKEIGPGYRAGGLLGNLGRHEAKGHMDGTIGEYNSIHQDIDRDMKANRKIDR